MLSKVQTGDMCVSLNNDKSHDYGICRGVAGRGGCPPSRAVDFVDKLNRLQIFLQAVVCLYGLPGKLKIVDFTQFRSYMLVNHTD